jgi:hypothetical protein
MPYLLAGLFFLSGLAWLFGLGPLACGLTLAFIVAKVALGWVLR